MTIINDVEDVRFREMLEKLQNGTDIRGVAIKTEEYNKNLTADVVYLIASGFSKWLKNKYKADNRLRIAVGMDSRLSGPELKSSIIEALRKSGIDVYDCGLATTPSMFMTTILPGYNCQGAIMITASHLPYYYNGLKLFTCQGVTDKKDIEEILDLATIEEKSKAEVGEITHINLIDDYSNILIDTVRKQVNSKKNYTKPLEGKKIIVDAGNGTGGFFATKVLKELGADIQGSQFLEADGRFPNHIPNPENEEAMESIKEAVLRAKADLGIIFDTDVDRSAIISKDGKEINKNNLIALISAIVLKEHPNTTIVTDSVTSNGLSEFISNLGGKHHRFKRGYRNVINEAIRLNQQGKESNVAIETSGHAALKENYFIDDGAYLIVKIIIEVCKLKEEGKDIGTLIKDLKEPLESKEVRIKIKKDDFREYGEMILERLKNHVDLVEDWSIETTNYEGIRVNCANENGWFLLRLSLHEPLLVLNIESNIHNGIFKIEEKIKNFINIYGLTF